MGNALYYNWSYNQRLLYDIAKNSSDAVAISFGVCTTHFVISEWISKHANRSHNSPVLVVSLVVGWSLWTLLFNSSTIYEIAESGDDKRLLSNHVATIVLGLGGWILNLTFSWLWYRCRSRRREVVSIEDSTTDIVEEGEISLVSPLIEDSALRNEDEYDPASQRSNDLATNNDTTMITPSLDIETPEVSNDMESSSVYNNARGGGTVCYINNIKIFLTNMVILYHTALQVQELDYTFSSWGSIALHTYTTINESYFMNTFFFYSGYFTPKSYDNKKGAYEFLFERVKRLGIPFVIYTFFLGTFVTDGVMTLLFQSPFEPISYSNDTGPMWFTCHLIIFNTVYTLACGKNWYPEFACPTLLGFFIIGAVAGLASGILMLFQPSDHGGRFLAVPMFAQDYISYVAYFFGGALAQRNNWMRTIETKFSRKIVYCVALLAISIVASAKHYANGNYDVVDELGKALLIHVLLNGILFKGILSMAMSLAVSVFFMDYGNNKYHCITSFFSKGMYTAYIIQFIFPIPIGYKCFILILEKMGQLGIDTDGLGPNPDPADTYYTLNEHLLFPGWLLVSAITLVIIWPMAYVIRSIPGFSQVL